MKKHNLLLLTFLLSGIGSAFAAPCPAKLPVSHHDGTAAGLAVAGGTQYFFNDALLGGFDCFERFGSYFPSYIHSKNSESPSVTVVDMAYSVTGTATFRNVVVPATGNYTMTVRYAFSTGLFGGVLDRPEGIRVNGVVVNPMMHFPVTGNFDTFKDSSIVIPLNAGQNEIQMFNFAPQSISRADSMTIKPAGPSNPTCPAVPSVPAALVATLTGDLINLNWTASTAPGGCAVSNYTVYRSTTPAFAPSTSNQISSGIAQAAYQDTTALCGTTYYYAVEATDEAGQSPASTQIKATTSTCAVTSGIAIDSGGSAVSPFVADAFFSGGNVIQHPNAIDTSLLTEAVPAEVFQTARTGNFNYTLKGFTPGSTHTVKLLFAETYFDKPGSRTFNVNINGTEVLKDFDIEATAKGKNKALVQSFPINTTSGVYVITFTSVVNNALISGIEIQ